MTQAIATRPNLNTHELIAQIEPVIRTHARESEQNRCLHPQVHEALVAAGLYKMFVPEGLGGLGLDVFTGFELLEGISRVDSAAGWSLQIAAAPVGMAALFEDETVRDLLGDQHFVTAGDSFRPVSSSPSMVGLCSMGDGDSFPVASMRPGC